MLREENEDLECLSGWPQGVFCGFGETLVEPEAVAAWKGVA